MIRPLHFPSFVVPTVFTLSHYVILPCTIIVISSTLRVVKAVTTQLSQHPNSMLYFQQIQCDFNIVTDQTMSYFLSFHIHNTIFTHISYPADNRECSQIVTTYQLVYKYSHCSLHLYNQTHPLSLLSGPKLYIFLYNIAVFLIEYLDQNKMLILKALSRGQSTYINHIHKDLILGVRYPTQSWAYDGSSLTSVYHVPQKQVDFEADVIYWEIEGRTVKKRTKIILISTCGLEKEKVMG